MTQGALATASMQEGQGAADYNDLSLNFMNLIEDRFSCRSKNPTAFCGFIIFFFFKSVFHQKFMLKYKSHFVYKESIF